MTYAHHVSYLEQVYHAESEIVEQLLSEPAAEPPRHVSRLFRERYLHREATSVSSSASTSGQDFAAEQTNTQCHLLNRSCVNDSFSSVNNLSVWNEALSACLDSVADVHPTLTFMSLTSGDPINCAIDRLHADVLAQSESNTSPVFKKPSKELHAKFKLLSRTAATWLSSDNTEPVSESDADLESADSQKSKLEQGNDEKLSKSQTSNLLKLQKETQSSVSCNITGSNTKRPTKSKANTCTLAKTKQRTSKVVQTRYNFRQRQNDLSSVCEPTQRTCAVKDPVHKADVVGLSYSTSHVDHSATRQSLTESCTSSSSAGAECNKVLRQCFVVCTDFVKTSPRKDAKTSPQKDTRQLSLPSVQRKLLLTDGTSTTSATVSAPDGQAQKEQLSIRLGSLRNPRQDLHVSARKTLPKSACHRKRRHIVHKQLNLLYVTCKHRMVRHECLSCAALIPAKKKVNMAKIKINLKNRGGMNVKTVVAGHKLVENGKMSVKNHAGATTKTGSECSEKSKIKVKKVSGILEPKAAKMESCLPADKQQKGVKRKHSTSPSSTSKKKRRVSESEQSVVCKNCKLGKKKVLSKSKSEISGTAPSKQSFKTALCSCGLKQKTQKHSSANKSPKKKLTLSKELLKEKRTWSKESLKKKLTLSKESQKRKYTLSKESVKKKQALPKLSPKKKQTLPKESPKKKLTLSKESMKEKRTLSKESLKKKLALSKESPKNKNAPKKSAVQKMAADPSVVGIIEQHKQAAQSLEQSEATFTSTKDMFAQLCQLEKRAADYDLHTLTTVIPENQGSAKNAFTNSVSVYTNSAAVRQQSHVGGIWSAIGGAWNIFAKK